MRKIAFIVALFSGIGLMAQIQNEDVYEVIERNNRQIRNEYRIPDVGKYQVLKCDFHNHTVFSDGHVWPTVRVAEAWNEGLDAIAITDHIEYRPYKDVVKGDLNESYKIAAKAAAGNGIIVIPGIEITRKKPLGHLNALFVKDANLMDVKDELEAVEEAVRQEAFIQWNHPGWPDDISTFYPIHEKLISEGKIHAVEVVNHFEFYPKVFDWFQKNNLAPVANTDSHGAVGLDFVGTRPMTLVFAKERSLEGIREALFARRTVALFDNTLIGTPELIKSLILSCFEINYAANGSVLLTNLSDITYRITTGGKLYIIPGGKTVSVGKQKDPYTEFQFENCYTGHKQKFAMSAKDWKIIKK